MLFLLARLVLAALSALLTALARLLGLLTGILGLAALLSALIVLVHLRIPFWLKAREKRAGSKGRSPNVKVSFHESSTAASLAGTVTRRITNKRGSACCAQAMMARLRNKFRAVRNCYLEARRYYRDLPQKSPGLATGASPASGGKTGCLTNAPGVLLIIKIGYQKGGDTIMV